jgi:hypothetical protein
VLFGAHKDLQHKCDHVKNFSKDRKTINISKIAVVLTRQWLHPAAFNLFITGTWSLGLGKALVPKRIFWIKKLIFCSQKVYIIELHKEKYNK